MCEHHTSNLPRARVCASVVDDMYVVKRNGEKHPVEFDKITSRIRRLAYGLDVDPVVVAQKVVQGLYNGVSTRTLDVLAMETAAYRASMHPDYGLLAGRIAVSDLHKCTKKSFSATVEDLAAQPHPLIATDVLDFVRANASTLDAAIVYDRDYAFDLFGFRTLEKSYLLKVAGRVVERPQHMLMRVACGIHCGDVVAAVET